MPLTSHLKKTLQLNIIYNNNAVLNGGALYSNYSGVMVKQKSTIKFTQNSTENGGAVFTPILLISEQSNV